MSSASYPTGHPGRRAPIVALAVVVSLCACGAKTPPATQVVAKVNKEEISVHQVNYVLQRTPGVTTETADAASRQILDRLISQELAVQKAEELKLDRTPATVQALEAARREVLARAYFDSLGDAVPKPTAEEVAAFYAQKPALFKERKVYTFQELSMAGTPAQMSQAQAALAAAKSAQEFADYLKGSGLKYGAKLTTQAAENLPLEMLDKIAALSPGQAIFLPQPGGAKALLLAAANPEPVDAATAAPAIEKYLLNDRKRIKTETEMKALRAASKVELVGHFADAGASAAGAVPVLATQPPAETPASSSSGLSADAVRKGLGFK